MTTPTSSTAYGKSTSEDPIPDHSALKLNLEHELVLAALWPVRRQLRISVKAVRGKSEARLIGALGTKPWVFASWLWQARPDTPADARPQYFSYPLSNPFYKSGFLNQTEEQSSKVLMFLRKHI